MNKSPPIQHLFSRVLDVQSLPDEPLPVTIVADDAEKAALAAANGLAGLDHLSADLMVSREGRSGLRVRGRLTAGIRQICVVSLDPFDAELSEPIEVHFLPESELAALQAERAHAKELDEANDELPDPIVGGRVDLGALTAEFLALALDPYPRKPGVAYAAPEAGAESPDRVSPFAALARLKAEKPL